MGFANTDIFISAISSGNVHRTDFTARHDHANLTSTAGISVGVNLSSSNGISVRNTFTNPNGNLGWTPCNRSVGNGTQKFGLPHGANSSPGSKHIIDATAVMPGGPPGVGGMLILADLQGYWPNVNYTITTSQALTGNATANLRYANGEGCRLFMVTTTAAGSTAQNIRINYTNEDGTSLRDTGQCAMRVSSQIGQISSMQGLAAAGNNTVFMPLANGDIGVANVSNVQFSAASTAGLGALCLARPLISIPFTTATYYPTEREFLHQTPSLPEVKDDACLVWLYVSPAGGTGAVLASNTAVYGSVTFAWN
jgi:hypothetical protein